MIYTVTFNPALDYNISVDHFELGMTNRSHDETLICGGKGINVSYILKQLGFDSVALGFVAGFTGQEFVKGIEKMGITSQMIELDQGMTRINVKLRGEMETEINGSGPDIPESSQEILFHQLSQLSSKDILVLSGSIPATLSDTIYQDIMAYLQGKEVLFVVDATNDLLMNVLKYKPFLIKPNHHELSEIFKVKIENDDDIIFYAQKLQEKGARNVLVSMAGNGSILVDERGQITKMKVPEGTLKNSVGAGDSMLAGFIGGYLNGYDYSKTLALATACGSATAFSDTLATHDEIMALFKKTQQMIQKAEI